jgi:predicted site-specific integrase-resolvase
MLGVSRRTIYYWIKDGRLVTRRTPLGSQRILLDSLALFTVQKPSVVADTVDPGN